MANVPGSGGGGMVHSKVEKRFLFVLNFLFSCGAYVGADAFERAKTGADGAEGTGTMVGTLEIAR
jgi:hypothetical protein